jgi:hypothetical protein
MMVLATEAGTKMKVVRLVESRLVSGLEPEQGLHRNPDEAAAGSAGLFQEAGYAGLRTKA